MFQLTSLPNSSLIGNLKLYLWCEHMLEDNVIRFNVLEIDANLPE